ncbi:MULTISPECIES: ATP-binding protein [Anaerostipes]|uniref:ATP-binding protein n=1 Tax=Anaerostipes hominis (ex Lee et al. 2021) TaxID=2025494 RepID=A0ABV4DIU9_9FIRM|nr:MULTISPECIES: ATP-binding protein [Anaerostipes]WRY46864.1 ATP-binding protein [Anaerostipes sp. PC18]
MEEYGGTIKAMSEKGRYTAFTITLPLVKQEN